LSSSVNWLDSNAAGYAATSGAHALTTQEVIYMMGFEDGFRT